MTRSARRRDDRGLAEGTSWALLMPLLLGIIFTIVSAGAWTHARMGASTAAAVAADHVASFDGQDQTATDKAKQIAERAGVTHIAVHIARDESTVTVTVTGRAALPIDLGLGAISEQAVRPRERISEP